MSNLTFDETRLTALYDGGTREKTIGKIKDMQQYLDTDEAELRLLSESTLKKLNAMTDEEYDELDLFPEV